MKSIVDPPGRCICRDPHYFVYADGATRWTRTSSRSAAPSRRRVLQALRLNHYFTRSEQEFRKKLEGQGRQAGRARSGVANCGSREQHEERDETIIAYLPALREALASGRDS